MCNPKKKAESVGFDLHMFSRLWKIMRIIFPGCCSVPTGLFFFLLFLCALEQFLAYHMGLVSSKYYTVFGNRNVDGFIWVTVQTLGIITAIASVKSVEKYIANILYITWRQLLDRVLHRVYFSGINYYTLNIMNSTVDNPDQRMTQDVDKLCFLLSTITTKVMISPFQIGYYTYQTFVGTGWIGILSIYGFFFVATIANRLIMSPIVKFVVKQEKCEGDFRFKHMHSRVNAESIAFHASGSVESCKTNRSLDNLIRAQQQLFNRQIWLDMVRHTSDYVGAIVSYLAIAIPIFKGQFGDGDVAPIISAYAFVSMYLISTLTSLVDLGSQVVVLSGVTHRVAQLIECLVKFQCEWDITTMQASSSFSNLTQNLRHRAGKQPSSDSKHLLEETEEVAVCGEDTAVLDIAFILSDVFITAPGSTKPLVTNLQLEIHRNDNLLIMGPSSSGKSSVLRVLRGLWPAAQGTVAHDLPPGPKTVIFLPQKPLMTNGSLLEQIVYPLRLDPNSPVSRESCDEILQHLEGLHMTGLLDRTGGLHNDPEWNWYDSLSPGEMQRVCFLRVLFHRPQFAFLDEATSALSVDVEEQLYSSCLQLNITLISVGHRDTLRKYHKNLLYLDGSGGWRIEPLPQSNNSNTVSALDS